MPHQFPVPFPPAPRLPLGQWVQTQFSYIPPDHPADPCYFKEQGIIIGYGFHHPVWSETNYIQTRQLPEDNAPQGWDYQVLRFRTWDDSTNEWRDGDSEVMTAFESDVTPIDPVKTFVSLGGDVIHEMFPGSVANVLTRKGSEARIQTHPYSLKLIAPDYEQAAKLWGFKNEIAQAIKTYSLPPDVVIGIPGEGIYTFTANEIPTIKLGNQHISLTMPAPIDDIEARVAPYRPLLEAAAFNNVGATLHDADPSTGYRYLEVCSPIPQRQNKPRLELIGKPCTIVDPRIGEPRLQAIRQALELGQAKSYHYDYEDTHYWEFDVTVAPIPGADLVITIVHDAAPWQLAHWQHKIYGATPT